MGRKAKTWEEHKAECEAVAKKGITILGFVEPWCGRKTKLICYCDKHGEWQTASINSFKQEKSCPSCAHQKAGPKPKEDSVHIKDFMKTGSFHPEAQFLRSEKSDNLGRKVYWNYTCPVCSNDEYVKAGLCSGVFEAHLSSLKKGQLSCRCSIIYQYKKEQWDYRLNKLCQERGYEFVGWKTEKFGSDRKFIYLCPLHGEQTITTYSFLDGQGCPECAGHNQQQGYINVVYDEEIPVSLKFGIANDSKVRLRGQNRRNLFQMKKMQVYEFSFVEDCKAAERACLLELHCGILSSRELQDGYTETTSIENLDKILEIYKRFGGVRVK